MAEIAERLRGTDAVKENFCDFCDFCETIQPQVFQREPERPLSFSKFFLEDDTDALGV